jgi:OmpA-OmpF porin, OOP family
MEAGTKILIGAGLTALLAWGSHSALNRGTAFVDGLEAKANASLVSNSIAGVTAKAERDPQIKRVIILSGDKNAEERKKIIAQMKAIPGIADARWDDDGAVATADIAPAPAKAEAPASKEAVAECQKDINTLMTGKTINFQSGSAYLAENNAVLDEIAAALKPCVGMSVEVRGHTDLSGSTDTNQKLSQDRAERVVAALVAKGVPAERMTAKGFGSSQPLVNARGDSANAKNRRTEFAVSAATAAAPAEGVK